jgi:hypothetical protein
LDYRKKIEENEKKAALPMGRGPLFVGRLAG